MAPSSLKYSVKTNKKTNFISPTISNSFFYSDFNFSLLSTANFSHSFQALVSVFPLLGPLFQDTSRVFALSDFSLTLLNWPSGLAAHLSSWHLGWPSSGELLSVFSSVRSTISRSHVFHSFS